MPPSGSFNEELAGIFHKGNGVFIWPPSLPLPISAVARLRSSFELRLTSFASWASQPRLAFHSFPSVLPISDVALLLCAPGPQPTSYRVLHSAFRMQRRTRPMPQKLLEFASSTDHVPSSTARQHHPCSSLIPLLCLRNWTASTWALESALRLQTSVLASCPSIRKKWTTHEK